MRTAKEIQDATQETIDRATRATAKAQKERNETPALVADLMNAVTSIQLIAVCEFLSDLRDQNERIIALLESISLIRLKHEVKQVATDTVTDIFRRAILNNYESSERFDA